MARLYTWEEFFGLVSEIARRQSSEKDAKEAAQNAYLILIKHMITCSTREMLLLEYDLSSETAMIESLKRYLNDQNPCKNKEDAQGGEVEQEKEGSEKVIPLVPFGRGPERG